MMRDLKFPGLLICDEFRRHLTMTPKQFLVRFSAISAVLAFGIATSPLFAPGLRAEQFRAASNSQNSLSDLVSVNFEPPSRGAPPVTAGGGSRGCGYTTDATEQPTALMPSNFLARTAEKSPTFLLYVPQSSPALEFRLLSKTNQKVVYKTAVAVPKESGIVKVSLPEEVSLDADEMYDWYLISICDASDRTGDAVTSGSLERVNPSKLKVDSGVTLEEALKTANLAERFSLYAKAGIWQDALATLAQIHQTVPEDKGVTASWEKLLQAGEFDRFAGVGFVEAGDS